MTSGDLPRDEENDFLDLMKSGQLDLARNKIAILSKKYPNVAKLHFNYALVLYKLKRYDEALEEVTSGLWLKPDDLKAMKFKKEIIEARSKVLVAETKPDVDDLAGSHAAGSSGTGESKETGPVPDTIASSQPETMPAVLVPTAPETEAIPQTEVMPSVLVPVLADASEKPAPAEPLNEVQQLPPSTVDSVPSTTSEPPAADLPSPHGTENLAQTAPPRDEKAAGTAAGNDVPPAAGAPPVEPPSGVPEIVSTANASTNDGPALIATIPGPSVVSSHHEVGIAPEPAVVVEVEPRITIHEKAADITVGSIETAVEPASPVASDPQGLVDVPMVEPGGPANPVNPATASPRLTNLKDLFKGPRTGPGTAADLAHDTRAVLADTVELEPGTVHDVEAPLRVGEGGVLTSFKSFKALESYKFSMQAIVEKFIKHKLDHELPDRHVDFDPLIVEDDARPDGDRGAFSEADLLPHEAVGQPGAADLLEASSQPVILGDAGFGEETATEASRDESLTAQDSPPSSDTTEGEIVRVEKPMAQLGTSSGPAPTSQGTRFQLNMAVDQLPLVAILSATLDVPLHRVEIDIGKHFNDKVMGFARAGELAKVRGETLAQIVDMETYATAARMNRLLTKSKRSLVNDIGTFQAGHVELYTASQPMPDYEPGVLAPGVASSVVATIELPPPASPTSLSKATLSEIIASIKKIGEEQVMMVAGGDDAPLKAATMRIKRTALDLYNNNQYEQAVLIYTAFLDYFPEDYEAMFNLGFCHRELGNYKESEQAFMKIIELFYDNAYAWYNLSVLYSITNEGAREAYSLQRAREFGYVVDVNRLSRLLVTYSPKNPFDV